MSNLDQVQPSGGEPSLDEYYRAVARLGLKASKVSGTYFGPDGMTYNVPDGKRFNAAQRARLIEVLTTKVRGY